jgi:hypothetical protein
MNSHESDEIHDLHPTHIILTDLYGMHPLKNVLTYQAVIAKILGTEVWLFCFKEE